MKYFRVLSLLILSWSLTTCSGSQEQRSPLPMLADYRHASLSSDAKRSEEEPICPEGTDIIGSSSSSSSSSSSCCYAKRTALDGAKHADLFCGPDPPPPPPPPKCSLTSATVATSPADTTRTTIGVGEQVKLTSDGSTWSVSGSGGTLSSTSGTTVTLTAAATAGSVTATVTGGDTCLANSLAFTVIAPSGDANQKINGVYHTVNVANVGIQTDIYLQPATVSFQNTYFLELNANAAANGTWTCLNGTGHGPNPTRLSVGAETGGLGSEMNGSDTAYSGSCGGVSQLQNSTETFNIPTQYSVGSTGTLYTYTTVAQTATDTTAGALSMSKGGAVGNTTVSSASSNY